MNLTFYSVDSNDEKVVYNTPFVRDENQIIFLDKSVSNTTIYLTILENSLLFERKGDIEMSLPLEMGKKTHCHYKNELGLEFDFLVLTNELLISSKRIEMEYSLFLEGDTISTHKITILFH